MAEATILFAWSLSPLHALQCHEGKGWEIRCNITQKHPENWRDPVLSLKPNRACNLCGIIIHISYVNYEKYWQQTCAFCLFKTLSTSLTAAYTAEMLSDRLFCSQNRYLKAWMYAYCYVPRRFSCWMERNLNGLAPYRLVSFRK